MWPFKKDPKPRYVDDLVAARQEAVRIAQGEELTETLKFFDDPKNLIEATRVKHWCNVKILRNMGFRVYEGDAFDWYAKIPEK